MRSGDESSKCGRFNPVDCLQQSTGLKHPDEELSSPD